MSKMRNNKCGSVSVSALAAALILCSCTTSSEIKVKPVDEAVTAPVTEAVTEAVVTEAVTEPAVTEPEGVVRTDPGLARVKPAEFEDNKYSGLNNYQECFNVKDGYYRINFLDDKLFEEEINSDIKSAMDSLRVHKDDFSWEAGKAHSTAVVKADGIVADLICRNGYLSIMLEYGYYEPYATDQAGAYSVLLKNKGTIYADYAVTLNYELTTKNKINSISELFYSGSDWNADVNSALCSEYNGVVSYFPEGTPELFTIDYFLVKTGDGDYAVERYNSENLGLSYCENMISAHYRSMAQISEKAADRFYSRYTQTTLETCPGCNTKYIWRRFDTSRFYSDSELSQMNYELERLYEHGFPGKENHECWVLRSPYGTVIQNCPDANRVFNRMYIWSCIDKSGYQYYYDPDSYESLSTEAVIGWDWRDYATSDDPDTPDISAFWPSHFISVKYDPDQHIVRAVLYGFSDTYQRNITVTADIPDDLVNQKYLCQ